MTMTTPRYLVVYYSRTGHTETVARAVAEALGADLETIREKEDRAGLWNYLRAGYESLTGKLPDIEPAQYDPAGYDVVLLGTPVWTGRPSTPMRAFIAANREKLARVAFFVTLGGSGDERTFRRMAKATAREPVATFSVTEPQLKSGEWKARVAGFVKAVVRG
jgi:flavodoxin